MIHISNNIFCKNVIHVTKKKQHVTQKHGWEFVLVRYDCDLNIRYIQVQIIWKTSGMDMENYLLG